jgi:hypothetical protein
VAGPSTASGELRVEAAPPDDGGLLDGLLGAVLSIFG